MGTTISGATGIDKVQDSSITSAKIANGAITNDDINSSAAIAGSKISGSFGKILQVVGMNSTTEVTVSASSATDTGFTANITPSATSSKIVVFFETNVANNNPSSYNRVQLKKVVGGSTTQLAEKHCEREAYYDYQMCTINYLDTPNTTSQITYKITAYRQGGGQGHLGINGTSTSLLLFEVGA